MDGLGWRSLSERLSTEASVGFWLAQSHMESSSHARIARRDEAARRDEVRDRIATAYSRLADDSEDLPRLNNKTKKRNKRLKMQGEEKAERHGDVQELSPQAAHSWRGWQP